MIHKKNKISSTLSKVTGGRGALFNRPGAQSPTSDKNLIMSGDEDNYSEEVSGGWERRK